MPTINQLVRNGRKKVRRKRQRPLFRVARSGGGYA